MLSVLRQGTGIPLSRLQPYCIKLSSIDQSKAEEFQPNLDIQYKDPRMVMGGITDKNVKIPVLYEA